MSNWPEPTPNQYFVHVASSTEGASITIAGFPNFPTPEDLRTAGLIKTEAYQIKNLRGDVVGEGVWS